MMKHEFELLAPAGSYEILKAVIAAGADAVYVGGNKFGARAYANNFTDEELLEAIDYVHLRGKKLFLTVNTLFKNNEIKEGLYEYLLPFYEKGLDAVIVQDFGALAYIRKCFPDLSIHTSTQMTVTGAEGALLMKSLGAERVVLARELSIDEMKYIHEESGVQLEAFIHGALCYSYSGQCLFSSLLGGRSGNRGRCAQPCRLSYGVLDHNKKEIKKDSYVLSLKDLCGIQYLKDLKEAGVYSLKIEGRMKQASYAAGVVSFYRKYIDLEKEVTREDMNHLLSLGNRCGFTSAYFHKQNDKDMVTFHKPSYEKSDEQLHKKMEAQYLGNKAPYPIRGQAVIKKEQPLQFYGEMELYHQKFTAYVQGPVPSEAKNKPLEITEVRQRLQKTGDYGFCFENLDVELDQGLFVPNGVLNQLKRDLLEQLEANVLNEYHRSASVKPVSDINLKSEESLSQPVYIATCETMEQVDKCIQREWLSTIYVDSSMFTEEGFLQELAKACESITNAGKAVYLRLPAIFRRRRAEFFTRIKEDLKNLPLQGFVVRNYEEIYYVSTSFPHKEIITDQSLYTYNDYAIRAFEEGGVKYHTIPYELNRKEIRNRNNQNSEIVLYGYYPLMTSAGCVHKNTSGCDKNRGITYLKDRYQVLFPVKNYCRDCYNVIYNSVPTMLNREITTLEEMNVSRFRLDFTIENGKETENVLLLMEGKGLEVEFTNGHYKRGVE